MALSPSHSVNPAVRSNTAARSQKRRPPGKETTCAQMTHRIIPTGGSHGSTSSQATGPSRGQGSGYRNNPGIGVIPVDVPHLHVTEVGSQHRDLGVDVGALVVPGLDTPHHHAVPQVVHARRAGPAGRGPAQLAAEHDEGAVSGVVADPVAAVGAEE